MPRDDASALSADKQLIFRRAAAEYASARDRMRLLAFLLDCDWDEDTAHEKMEDLAELIRTTPVPTIRDVRAFYEMDGDRPPPCMVLLEDGHGDCARAKDGSPIVVGFGALRGSSEEIIQQIGFVFSRVERYIHDTEMPRVMFVTDFGARKGMHDLQTNPDMAVGTFMSKFPMSYHSLSCGVEAWMAEAAEKAQRAAKAVVSASMYERAVSKFQMSAGYEILSAHIHPENLLASWHAEGGFAFSLPDYVAYLEGTS